MDGAMVNDQVDNLLLAEAGLKPKVREGEVVATLALVLEIMPLPEPGVLEAHVQRHPAVENLLRDASLRVDRQRFVAEILPPIARDGVAGFRVGDPRLVEELRKVAWVIPPASIRVDDDILRVLKIFCVDGAGDPQYARQVGKPVEGPTLARRVPPQQRLPSEYETGCLAPLLIGVEHQRLFEQPPGMRAVTRRDHQGGGHRYGDHAQGIRNRGWQLRLGVRIGLEIKVRPEAGQSRDLV